MNREGLHRIIRAAAAMLGEDTVVIIGSQSILASFREFMLPHDATMSAEADILPFDDDDEVKADKVDGLLGEASHFAEKYGIYADGVSPWTASLPDGWDERLVRIEDPESGAVGLCLSPEDLCVAKVLAGRAKDIRFLTAVFQAGLGHNGVEHVDGDGYVAAAFRHRTSRAGDPQLHWHVLVANTTRCPDGRWRTLDGTRLYPALRVAGFLFEAEIRHQLTDRLGVQWRPARNGISEIDGAPAAVLRHFSKRRSQIEDRLAIKGYSSGRAAQVAALSTRDRKTAPESDQTLRERWRLEAESIGFDPATLDRMLNRPRRSSCSTIRFRLR